MISMLMHSSRKITAETVPNMQTCGVREQLWGEDTGSCPITASALSHY